MTQISDRIAFVTGAASGIGYALCQALLEKGAKVMMADIDGETLNKAYETLSASIGGNDNIGSVICDVADIDSVRAAAQATLEKFGKVHLVFNNAGVSLGGRPGHINIEDWHWITDINLLGLVHGCETFIPHILSHKEGGHIVNTASMAGHIASVGMSAYFATKFAAVGYSEALQQELAGVGIGVSCLCPTWVKSNIHNTAEKSPSHVKSGEMTFKNSQAFEMIKSLVENGMEASRYAGLVMTAIETNRLHVFNDPSVRHEIVKRNERLLADYDACLDDLGLS